MVLLEQGILGIVVHCWVPPTEPEWLFVNPSFLTPFTSSAFQVLLVEDNLTGQVDGDGAEDGRAGDVGSDGLSKLYDHAHEEGGKNLREQEGAV